MVADWDTGFELESTRHREENLYRLVLMPDLYGIAEKV
ncbi:MAG: hypothetical protein JWR51_2562 [Devosia sp.]|nr:hypothetical protein [Devosia sp.]